MTGQYQAAREILERVLRTPSSPSSPEARRRSYIRLSFLSLVVSVAGFLVSINSDGLASITRIYPVFLTLFSMTISFAAFVLFGFLILQILLEYDPVKKISTKEIGDILSSAEFPATVQGANKNESTLQTHAPVTPRFIRTANAMRSRLNAEIRAQGRRANTNLSMGVVTALLGLFFLGWLSFDTAHMSKLISDSQFSESVMKEISFDQTTIAPMLYWGQFFAKITLSASANVFSFFFLSTYRRNLTEIKYFQNELTNVDAHLVALYYAEAKSFSDTQKKLLIKFSEVERNFVLRRGESTSDVRLRELENADAAVFMNVISSLARGQFGVDSAPTPRERPAASRRKKRS